MLQEAVQSAILQGPQATVKLPSGEQVPVRSLVVPPVKGRKVVLLGDTCDSHAMLSKFWRLFAPDSFSRASRPIHTSAMISIIEWTALYCLYFLAKQHVSCLATEYELSALLS